MAAQSTRKLRGLKNFPPWRNRCIRPEGDELPRPSRNFANSITIPKMSHVNRVKSDHTENNRA